MFYAEDANNLSPEKAAAKEKELTAEAEKTITKLLKPEQPRGSSKCNSACRWGLTRTYSALRGHGIAEGIGLTERRRRR